MRIQSAYWLHPTQPGFVLERLETTVYSMAAVDPKVSFELDHLKAESVNQLTSNGVVLFVWSLNGDAHYGGRTINVSEKALKSHS